MKPKRERFAFRLGEGDDDIADVLDKMYEGEASRFVKGALHEKLAGESKLDKLIAMVQELLNRSK